MLRQFINMFTKGPSLDRILESFDQYLENFETLIQPSPTSKPRTRFDSNLPKRKMWMFNTTISQKLKFARQAVPLFKNMQKTAKLYDGKFKPTKDLLQK